MLLKLLFSVLLPGRRLVLGANSNTKTLENFVLTGDTGHVLLEWRRVTAEGQALGERLLTGKVYEWRGRRALRGLAEPARGVVHAAARRGRAHAQDAAYPRGARR